MPLLDDELESALLKALLKAFLPRVGDRRELDAGDREELAAFLQRHKGAGLLTRSRGQVGEIELDLP